MTRDVSLHTHKSIWKKKNVSLLTVLIVSLTILVLWYQTFSTVPTPYQDTYVRETGKDITFTYCGETYSSISVLIQGIDIVKRYVSLTDGKYFACKDWNEGRKSAGIERIVPTVLPLGEGVYKIVLSREISEGVSKPFLIFIVTTRTNEILTNDREFIGSLSEPITTFDECLATKGSTGTYTEKEQVCTAPDGRIFPDISSDWYISREFVSVSIIPRMTYTNPLVVKVFKKIPASVEVTLVSQGDERVLGGGIVQATTSVPVTLLTATTTYPFGDSFDAFVLIKILDDTQREFRIPIKVNLAK